MNRLIVVNAALLVLVLLMPGEAWAVGDDCASAVVIGGLPFNGIGNTCPPAFTDFYDEHCGNHSGSADIVYTYTEPFGQCVNVGLCGPGTSFDTKLYVYAGACPAPGSDNTGTQIACDDDDACGPGDPASAIYNLQLDAGMQYFFVVDGSNNGCGDYQIDIVPCAVQCVIPEECNDGDPCTTDDCVANQCVNDPIPGCCTTDPECNDGDPCTTDACIGNTCVNDSIIPCVCTCDAHCDDGNPCTEDQCCDGICENPPLPTGFPCDDDDLCTASDGCAGGLCSGAPIDCSFLDDDCNVGACDEQTGSCLTVPDNEGAACDDGLNCTGGETCTIGVCGGGSPPDCDDLDPCTDDFCDEANQACVHTPIPGCCQTDADCDDGLYCNGQEFCDVVLGQCQPGTPPLCDDLDPCTLDSCDDDEGMCQHEAIEPCCTTAEECDDANECTDNICNPQNQCENPPLLGAPCGNQSTTECTDPDTCDLEGTCQPNHTNEAGLCDDADACTDGDTCSAGACGGADNGTCSSCAQAGSGDDPRNQLGFQAKLKNTDGSPILDPTVNLEFRFYDIGDFAVGSPVTVNNVQCIDWGDGHCGVSTQIPIDETRFGEAVRLGVSVNGGDQLQPFVPISSAARSFRVGCATGDEIADHLKLGGSDTSGALQIFAPGGPGRGYHSKVELSGDSVADFGVGVYCGSETLRNDHSYRTVELNACGLHKSSSGATTRIGGELRLSNEDGRQTVYLRGGRGGNMGETGGTLVLRNWLYQDTVKLSADGTDLRLFDDNGNQRVWLKARLGAYLSLRQEDGGTSIILDGDEGGYGEITVKNKNATDAVVLDGGHNHAGYVRLKDFEGNDRVLLEGHHKVDVDGTWTDRGGQVSLRNSVGKDTVYLHGGDTNGRGGGEIRVRNASGKNRIRLYGDYSNGKGRIFTDVLRIRGGSDLAEQFDVRRSTGDVKPGMVVSIDPAHPGKLIISDRAYDHRVAGIISGAGGVEPGMLMGQSGSEADGEHPVALTGRVYCWADASNGPIRPGDLLTTSDTPGHAMRVSDHAKAHGAVLGKAMNSLEHGTGLVLVLVSLQ